MRKTIFSWTKKLLATLLLCFSLLVVIILNPVLSYGSRTKVGNFTVYHSSGINSKTKDHLVNGIEIVSSNELFDKEFRLDICLNDGSLYPSLIKKLQGDAFAWGFSNKVVIAGHIDAENNCVTLNNRSWNLEQLVAHEATHCYQYHELGLIYSKPFNNIPTWKWEGYAEFVSRKNVGLTLKDAFLLYDRIDEDDDWIVFPDKTGTVPTYFKYWLLVRYCIEVKLLTFHQLLKLPQTEDQVWTELRYWVTHEGTGRIR